MFKKGLTTAILSLALISVFVPFAARAYVFTNQLDSGDRGADVSALQQVLKDLTLFTYPTITGYFGPVTQAAVKAFQSAKNIVSSGTPDSTGYGRVGPRTLIALNGRTATSTATTTPPQPPLSLKVDSQRSYQITISWSAVSDATFYTLKRKESGTNDYVVVATATTTIYTDTTVRGGKGYSYIVTASNTGGESGYSSVVGAIASSPGGGGSGGSTQSTPSDTIAPNISSVATTGVSTSTESIAWATDENATSRVAYGSTSSYDSYTTLDSSLVSSHSVSLTGLTASTTYHYAVVSTDSSGNTATSSDGTFTTSVYDYFVDSVNGNDSNTGLTSALALQTISALQAKGMWSGVKIGLAKGSSWREQLTVTQSNATIEAYGTGAKPLLDASDAIGSSAWSKTGGYTNVYQASVPIDITTNHGGARYMGVWINNTRLTQATSLANLDSTAGSYFLTSTSTSPITLYVHSTGDTVPSSDGKTYEYTNRAHGLDTFDATAVTIRGIHGRRNFDSYGSIVVGRSGSAYDIQTSEGNTHNILVRANTYVDGLTADEAYANVGSEIPFVAYEATAPANSTVTCLNCTVTRTSGSGTGFYAHTGGSTSFTTYTITNPTVSQIGSSIGFNAANTDNLIITNATVSSGQTAVKSGAASTTVNTLTFTPTVAGQAVMQTDIASTTWSVANVSVTTGSINTGAFFQASHASTTATITGTTYSSAATKGHIYAVRGTTTGFHLTATQNNWRANSGGTCYSFSNGTGLQYTSDFNNFQTDCAFSIAGTPYATVAAYKTGTGQDANSTGP